jgi:hypothetical protein
VILSVDLASQFSAAMVTDERREVHWQGDSGGVSSVEWARTLARVAMVYDVEIVLIEDVPYSVMGQGQTKGIFRLQGIIMAMMHKIGDRVLWINPQEWQKTFPGVGTAPKEIPKGAARLAYRVEAARVHALNLGYTPPDLIAQYVASLPEGTRVLKKFTNPLAKTMTDYVDAYLISHWAWEHHNTIRSFKGVQPSVI